MSDNAKPAPTNPALERLLRKIERIVAKGAGPEANKIVPPADLRRLATEVRRLQAESPAGNFTPQNLRTMSKLSGLVPADNKELQKEAKELTALIESSVKQSPSARKKGG